MRKKPIDPIDILIINRLAQNANVTNKQLADEIGLSPGPTLVRVQKLWKSGILSNYKAEVDYPYFGYTLKSVCIFTIPDKDIPKFSAFIHKTKEIIYCAELEKRSPVLQTSRFLTIMMLKSKEHLDDLIINLNRKAPSLDIDIASVNRVMKEGSFKLNQDDV